MILWAAPTKDQRPDMQMFVKKKKKTMLRWLLRTHTNPSTHNRLYIYIYITVLAATKSLCGFASNQVQYKMESPKYLG